MSILDNIEGQPQKQQVWALVKAVRSLERQMNGLKHAAWAVALAFLIAGLGFIGNVLSGLLTGR